MLKAEAGTMILNGASVLLESTGTGHSCIDSTNIEVSGVDQSDCEAGGGSWIPDGLTFSSVGTTTLESTDADVRVTGHNDVELVSTDDDIVMTAANGVEIAALGADVDIVGETGFSATAMTGTASVIATAGDVLVSGQKVELTSDGDMELSSAATVVINGTSSVCRTAAGNIVGEETEASCVGAGEADASGSRLLPRAGGREPRPEA